MTTNPYGPPDGVSVPPPPLLDERAQLPGVERADSTVALLGMILLALGAVGLLRVLGIVAAYVLGSSSIYMPYTGSRASQLPTLIVAPLQVIAGIGLLVRAPWAIAVGRVAIIISLVLALPLGLGLGVRGYYGGYYGSSGYFGMIYSFLISLASTVPLDIILLYFITRPAVKAACRKGL